MWEPARHREQHLWRHNKIRHCGVFDEVRQLWTWFQIIDWDVARVCSKESCSPHEELGLYGKRIRTLVWTCSNLGIKHVSWVCWVIQHLTRYYCIWHHFNADVRELPYVTLRWTQRVKFDQPVKCNMILEIEMNCILSQKERKTSFGRD